MVTRNHNTTRSCPYAKFNVFARLKKSKMNAFSYNKMTLDGKKDLKKAGKIHDCSKPKQDETGCHFTQT